VLPKPYTDFLNYRAMTVRGMVSLLDWHTLPTLLVLLARLPFAQFMPYIATKH
jgi:hypothetical protein